MASRCRPPAAASAEFDAAARRLLDGGGVLDPYPLYRRLRTLRPVGWTGALGGVWMVTGFAAVAKVLQEGRVSMERGLAPTVEALPGREEEYKAYIHFLVHSMLVRDGASHRRLRSAVAPAFTPAAVRRQEPLVRRTAARLLTPLLEQGELDFARQVAAPLPIAVVAGILGLPPEDWGRLHRWADDLTVFLGGGGGVAGVDRALGSCLAMSRYFDARLEECRRRPGDDLISRLLATQAEGARLSQREVRAQCILLFTAGHQTTRDLVSTAVWLLLRHPKSLEGLRRRPGLIASAVEECLRYDGPVQLAGRMATAPFEVGGERIAEEQRLLLVLGAANRDPARFAQPGRFLVTRSPNRHLAFGLGSHGCLGAVLARREARVVLEVLLESCPDLRLAGEPVREPNPGFRRIASLPVAVA